MTMIKRWWKLGLLLLIVALLGFWVYGLIAVRGTFAPFRSAEAAGGKVVAAGVPGHRMVGRVYVVGTPLPSAPLIVVLHGDAPFIHPGYQYQVAGDLARAVPGIRVVALMRPGYADAYGARSDGDRGFASGDNYTASVVKDLAAAILALKQQWGASAVFLLGHSGGAAVAANIAAFNPGLVRHVFLAGCPCDVPAFRWHMAQWQWSPTWLLPVRSLSPLVTLERMDQGTDITAISGADDPVTSPEYAQRYIAKAKARGISASMLTLPNEGHEILDHATLIQAVTQAVHDEH
ncbi:alpha/beta hydrolase family protein [Dyella silvatica]|uniref:alpha/beta hydrolase family protein n=1 Tax=Dyella silvatica TaxID=2992128 RepID=UPI002257FD87|nr:alpha/beta fold hydrolase [Dyella silvatica]